jgi:hypothetical protein
LATSNDEVDLAVSLLECPIGVAAFGWWRWSSLLPVVVAGTVVVLATSIITLVVSSVVVTITMAIITTITFVVVTLVVAVIATVVVTFVITAVVAVIIASIPIVIVRIGPAVMVISSIRSTVTIVEVLATIAVVVAVASGPFGGRWDSKGKLQLLALPHGVLGVTVELALVVHDHIEVTFEEGGRSLWICHIGFARSLARLGASIVMVFSIKFMHYCVLRVDQFVDVGHEVTNGFCVGFVDLLKQLDVGDSLFVVGNDVIVFDTCNGVAVLEVAVGVLIESLITSHLHSGEAVSMARAIVGRLVDGHEEKRQSCPGGDALYRLSTPRSGALPIMRGKYPAMWSSLPPEARAAMLYILSHILGSERQSYFSIAGLKSLGYLIVRRRREKDGKLLTAPGLADGA